MYWPRGRRHARGARWGSHPIRPCATPSSHTRRSRKRSRSALCDVASILALKARRVLAEGICGAVTHHWQAVAMCDRALGGPGSESGCDDPPHHARAVGGRRRDHLRHPDPLRQYGRPDAQLSRSDRRAVDERCAGRQGRQRLHQHGHTARRSGNHDHELHSTLLHQGMVIVGVPIRRNDYNMDEISGGSPYGAATLTESDGLRQPSENELAIARFQGRMRSRSPRRSSPAARRSGDHPPCEARGHPPARRRLRNTAKPGETLWSKWRKALFSFSARSSLSSIHWGEAPSFSC